MYQSIIELYQLTMATIRARKRTDGSISYTAQIRLIRDGQQVYQESQTFARKQAAQAWTKKRETELNQPGAIERAHRKVNTVKDMIDRYLVELERARPLGKTKRGTLLMISQTYLGKLLDHEINSQHLVEFALWRMSPAGGTVKPQTAGNDLAHLGAVLSIAKPAWGYEVDPHAMADELDKLLSHFQSIQAYRPTSLNMLEVAAFAIFSTRRQEAITRIRWADLDEANSRILVRDMKNPGQNWQRRPVPLASRGVGLLPCR